MFISATLKSGSQVRVAALDFASLEEAITAFVNRTGPYAADWIRVDSRGTPRYIRYDHVVDVQGNDGDSALA